MTHTLDDKIKIIRDSISSALPGEQKFKLVAVGTQYQEQQHYIYFKLVYNVLFFASFHLLCDINESYIDEKLKIIQLGISKTKNK